MELLKRESKKVTFKHYDGKITFYYKHLELVAYTDNSYAVVYSSDNDRIFGNKPKTIFVKDFDEAVDLYNKYASKIGVNYF